MLYSLISYFAPRIISSRLSALVLNQYALFFSRSVRVVKSSGRPTSYMLWSSALNVYICDCIRPIFLATPMEWVAPFDSLMIQLSHVTS